MLGNTALIVQSVHCLLIKENRQTFHITDLGCGGGDVLAAVIHKLNQKGIKASGLGIDANPHSLEFARKKYAKQHTISFQCADIMNPEFTLTPTDILISSHFMYHFQDEKLSGFLSKQLASVQHAIVISELERNVWAYRLFKLLTPVLRMNKMVKSDGLLAIKRAFTRKEFDSLMQKSGIIHYKLYKKPFFRLLLVIENV